MPTSQSTIVEPRLACRHGQKADPIECSLHTLPKPLLREFEHVFGKKYLESDDDNDATMMDTSPSNLELLAIPTNQQARHDLVAVGDEIEEEKDRLLNCVRRQKWVHHVWSFPEDDEQASDGAFKTSGLFSTFHSIWYLTRHSLLHTAVYGVWRRSLPKDSTGRVLGRLH